MARSRRDLRQHRRSQARAPGTWPLPSDLPERGGAEDGVGREGLRRPGTTRCGGSPLGSYGSSTTTSRSKTAEFLRS
jgi:hypothetical protein